MENSPLSKRDPAYSQWLVALKAKFQRTQITAAVAVNQQLLQFYWELGGEIVEKQKAARWGSGFLKHLSNDLMAEFPEIKGFSKRNLEQIRRWVAFWSESPEIAKQAASQLSDPIISLLTSIPWWHNIVIITKCRTSKESLYYVRQTIQHGWSRAVLTHQIEIGLWEREGSAISNFSATLPSAQSDLARQTLKDPYVFDFLTLTAEHNERDLENQITEHITKFLLELGAGFAYLGRQMPLEVGERDFFLDLLFYHTRLHCYVVIELKTGDFEPEHAGKLNFYIKAVDEKFRKSEDQPTIGILICKTRNTLVAEYALSDIQKPIGVSEYRLTKSLPDQLKPSLPSVEALEAELGACQTTAQTKK